MNALKALQTERHNRPDAELIRDKVRFSNSPLVDTISPLVNSIEISKRTQAEQELVRKRLDSTNIYTDDKYFPTRRRPKTLQNEPKPAALFTARTDPRP